MRNYDLENITVREDKPNFSENTDFREILFTLKKGISPENFVNFVIVRNLNELFISHLREILQNFTGKIHRDTNFELRRFKQSELSARNLFCNVSLSDFDNIEIWKRISKSKNLISLKDLDPDIVRGPEHQYRGGRYPQMSLLDSKRKYLKRSDFWLVENVTDDLVRIKHRHLRKQFKIPIDRVFPNLRRVSGVKEMDVTNLNEFVVHSKFAEANSFLSKAYAENASFSREWKKYLGSRKSHLALNWRFDVSADGTKLLAFYSGKERVFSKMMWIARGFDQEESKLLLLYLNSSINLLQLLIERSPTRGVG